MKSLLIIFAALIGLNTAQAQGKAPNILKQEMQKVAYMVGQWSGEATMRQPDGSTLKVNQEENVQFKLDKTLLLIEGTGRGTEAGNAIVFNALAVITYNQYTKAFAMKSHLMDGNQTEAYFKILEDNHFEWGFETPTKAKIKYTIVLNSQSKTWAEKGAYSPDGNTWLPFLEMNLKKISE